jgi:hypothetical protein
VSQSAVGLVQILKGEPAKQGTAISAIAIIKINFFIVNFLSNINSFTYFYGAAVTGSSFSAPATIDA